MDWSLILGGVALGVVGIAVWQYRAARAQFRPLASRQPQRNVPQTPELGMEAIDMAEIRRTQRSNESLERTNNIWARQAGTFTRIDTNVDAMPDDETYAQRFHAAFMKNKE
ncbi:hypothetical protein [uncultured Sulfitobacter sp.]|uniref:hypothetical protein n=1 Tax=uncultured Sulfitobacter sp. TaxID=191468 RepID=UPI002616411E|nr:hypothetical protein [uncultured Sulfitobacter sp.]